MHILEVTSRSRSPRQAVHMPRRPPPSRPPQHAVPSPPPGARRDRGDASSGARSLPPLPSRGLGAPPGRPPGAAHAAPGVGGLQGLGTPPEIRRRSPGAMRAAPGAMEVAGRMRLALRTAQRKLLESQQKLRAGAAVVRAKLAARR